MSNIYIQIDDDTYLSIHQDDDTGIQECVPMLYKDNTMIGQPIYYSTVDEMCHILDDVAHRDYYRFYKEAEQFIFTFDEADNDN